MKALSLPQPSSWTPSSIPFRLETIHPFAPKATEVFGCAHEQGKGEEMHSCLFASQRLQPEVLDKHAQALGLRGWRSISSGQWQIYREDQCQSQGGLDRRCDGHAGFLPRIYPGRLGGGQSHQISFHSRGLPFATFKEHIDKLLDANIDRQ
jgi:hypothetical protein